MFGAQPCINKDELFQQFNVAEPSAECPSGNKSTRVCLNPTCEVNALHCHSDQCHHCSQRHIHCNAMSLISLTQKVQKQAENKKDFLKRVIEVEQQTIEEIQKQRKTLVNSLLFGDLNDRGQKTIKKIFMGEGIVTGKDVFILNQNLQTNKKEKLSDEEETKILTNMTQKQKELGESMKILSSNTVNKFVARQTKEGFICTIFSKIFTFNKWIPWYYLAILALFCLAIISALSTENFGSNEALVFFGCSIVISCLISWKITNLKVKVRQQVQKQVKVQNKKPFSQLFSSLFPQQSHLQKQIQEVEANNKNTYFKMGKQLSFSYKYKEAVQSFRKAIQIDPQDKENYIQMAYVLVQLHRFQEAVKVYEIIIKLDPQDQKAQLELISNLKQLDRYQEIVQIYQRNIEKDPENMKIYSQLIKTLQKLNKLSDVLQIYKQILRINPTDKKAHFQLGNLLFKLDRYTEALQSYKNFLKLEPQNIKILENIAACYQELNQIQESIKINRKITEVDPININAYRRIRDHLLTLDRKTQANLVDEKINKLTHRAFINQSL